MLERTRKGITPVIAIVLLLMMTVAAAGGAYAWLTQLQEQFQNQAESSIERGIDIVDLRCYNEDASGHIEVFFKNSGTKALDLNPVDMNIRSGSTGNINYTLTRTGLKLSQTGGLGDGITFVSGDSDFSEPGESAPYLISTEPFNAGDRYQIDFVFTDEDGTTKTGNCQADNQ